MRFEHRFCPVCNGGVRGTLDSIVGVAELYRVDGNTDVFEFVGETDVDWDSQMHQSNPLNKAEIVLICHRGHTWYSTILPDEPVPSPEDILKEEIRALFHKLWGEAAGSKTYTKQDWNRLQYLLQRHFKVPV